MCGVLFEGRTTQQENHPWQIYFVQVGIDAYLHLCAVDGLNSHPCISVCALNLEYSCTFHTLILPGNMNSYAVALFNKFLKQEIPIAVFPCSCTTDKYILYKLAMLLTSDGNYNLEIDEQQ